MNISLLLLTAALASAADKPAEPKEAPTALATFAGGCFWCMESEFQPLDGVLEVVSGFANGTAKNPSYEQVAQGLTDYREAVQVRYDPAKVSYEKLLDIFWSNFDPTDDGGQFADRGDHYRSGLFYHDEKQKAAAEASKKALSESKRFKAPIVTRIEPFKNFYPADEHHQDYYKKNPIRYKMYRGASGRDAFLRKAWKGKK